MDTSIFEMTFDDKTLSKVALKDTYPLPSIEEKLSQRTGRLKSNLKIKKRRLS